MFERRTPLRRPAFVAAVAFASAALANPHEPPPRPPGIAAPGEILASCTSQSCKGVWRIDPTAVEAELVVPGNVGYGLAFDGDGDVLSVGLRVTRIDFETGEATPLDLPDFNLTFWQQVGVAPDGSLLTLSTDHYRRNSPVITRWNLETGEEAPLFDPRVAAPQPCRPWKWPCRIGGFAVDAEGGVYFSLYELRAVLRFDPNTGVASVLADAPELLPEPGPLAIAPGGDLLIASRGDSPLLQRLDPRSGELSVVSETFGGDNLRLQVGSERFLYRSRGYYVEQWDLEFGIPRSLGEAGRDARLGSFMRDFLVVPGPPPTPACRDGYDNDGDHRVDYPADPGCTRAGDGTETGLCDDGRDNDGDGLTDHPDDPGCADASSRSQEAEEAQCSDRLDNDGDGWQDYPHDPECESPDDDDEHWAPRGAARRP